MIQARALGTFEELQAAHRELRVLGIAVEPTIEHSVTRSGAVLTPTATA